MEWRPFDTKNNPYASSANPGKPPMMTKEETAAFMARFSKPEPTTEPLPPLTKEESRLLLEHATWKGEIETSDWGGR